MIGASVKRRTDGLSVFIVDLKESLGKGVEIRPIEAMINHNTTEVFFDNLKVPAENLIGEEGRGFRYILDGMNAERILIASEAIGDARWFIRTAASYAKSRVVFDRPIGQNQGVAFPIARAHAETDAADLMVRKAAALFDAGAPCGPAANMAKALPSASMFGHEMLASIAATPGTLISAARVAKSSAVGAEIETTRGGVQRRYSGIVWRSRYGTPFDGIPIALSMPPVTSATRGSGLPARNSRVIVLVTSAPSWSSTRPRFTAGRR